MQNLQLTIEVDANKYLDYRITDLDGMDGKCIISQGHTSMSNIIDELRSCVRYLRKREDVMRHPSKYKGGEDD